MILKIKNMLSNPLYYSIKIKTVLNYKLSGKLLILMYHRIVNKRTSNIYLQDGMYVDPDTFRMHIKYLIRNFTVVSLDCIPQIVHRKSTLVGNKPYCILTFDDGWRDFYENAFPILRTFNVCATVFLPIDFIGTNNIFWTDRLSNSIYNIEQSRKNGIIGHNNIKYRIDNIDKILNMNISIGKKIDLAIKTLKLLHKDEIDDILSYLTEKYSIEIKHFNSNNRYFLSWEEIREMHGSGIIYFGSHSKSHILLNNITEKEIRNELILSKNKLIEENLVQSSFIPFAYPNGNYTEKIARMVEEAGYSLALTTQKGWNRITDKDIPLYQLKRVGIHQDMTNTNAMFACRIHGLY